MTKGPTVSPGDVTALLGEWSRGNRTALTQLLPVVYGELRRVAARQLRNERTDHTLQPTALVHEVYMRLVGQRQVDWHESGPFLWCRGAGHAPHPDRPRPSSRCEQTG